MKLSSNATAFPYGYASPQAAKSQQAQSPLPSVPASPMPLGDTFDLSSASTKSSQNPFSMNDTGATPGSGQANLMQGILPLLQSLLTQIVQLLQHSTLGKGNTSPSNTPPGTSAAANNPFSSQNKCPNGKSSSASNAGSDGISNKTATKPSPTSGSQSLGNDANGSNGATTPPPTSGSQSSGDNTPISNTGVSGNGTKNGVAFGVNGHPTWGNSSYQKLTPDQQMQKVKSLGLGTYAIDFNSNSGTQDQQLLDAAKRNGVDVQVNMGVDRNKLTGYQDAYQAAFKEGAAVGKQVNGQAKYFQMDNELDQFVDPSGTGQIDPQKYQVALGIMKGMSAGLKSSDPNAKTIVNSTTAPSGVSFLKKLQQDGADWDVTGYHMYSQTGSDVATVGTTQNGGGTTLQNVHDLGKPIWITEFNGQANGGSGPSANRSANASIIANEMKGITDNAQKYNIIGANVHELMDEPERNSAEAQYGVLDGTGNDTATSSAIKNFMGV